jgi:hypothetical protein
MRKEFRELEEDRALHDAMIKAVEFVGTRDLA